MTADTKLYSNLGHCQKMRWQSVTNHEKVGDFPPSFLEYLQGIIEMGKGEQKSGCAVCPTNKGADNMN